MQALAGRPFALVTAALFAASWVFPIVAGLSKDTASFPRWWGVVDVALAFVLAVLAFTVVGVWDKKVGGKAVDQSYRAYRVLLHGPMALSIVFFALGDRVTWINCLTGFAWRAWLLLYVLPSWFAAFDSPAGQR